MSDLSTDATARITYRKDRDRWKAVLTPPGADKVLTKLCRTKGEAEAWLVEQAAAVRESNHHGSMTVHDFAEHHFWPRHQDRTDAERRRHYDLYVKPRWGDVPLESIRRHDVLDWIDDLKTTPKRKGGGLLGGGYVRSIYYSSFSAIIRAAYDHDFLVAIPLPLSPDLNKMVTRPIRILRPREIEYLASSLRDRVMVAPGRYRSSQVVPDWPLMHYALVYTLAYAGLRLSEALALQASDLEVEHCKIHVLKQLTISGEVIPQLKTRNSYRRVAVSRPLMDLLVAHVDTNKIQPNGLLFTTKLGGPVQQNNWRQRWFDVAAEACGMKEGDDPVTPHTLRHVAATAWHEAGFDVLEVANFLGDTPKVVQETYIATGVWNDRDARHERMDERFLEGLKPVS